MARYVTLIRFTDQGARNIKKSPDRALTFKKVAAKAGVAVETQLWTAGAFDGVLILSGDEKKALRCLAQLAALGNVRTETLQAFDAREFKTING
ncbi:MAG TPA: GYD domain-containing protein [Verrucomicrobiae bacterium]|nr:GYD domain-containing protein [Verrucomicrobiae bacterium]